MFQLYINQVNDLTAIVLSEWICFAIMNFIPPRKILLLTSVYVTHTYVFGKCVLCDLLNNLRNLIRED